VISISDEPRDTIEQFLERKHDATTFKELTSDYWLTTDPDGSAKEDYMRAAGKGGIPTAFIVGKTGEIEWIGHPMRIDEPVAQILDGTWDRETYERQRQEEQEEFAKLRVVHRHVQKKAFTEALAAIDEILEGEWSPETRRNIESTRKRVELQAKAEARRNLLAARDDVQPQLIAKQSTTSSAGNESRAGRSNKLVVAIPMQSDRPVQKLVDRLNAMGFDIVDLADNLKYETIAEFPLIYIQGGSFHDQKGYRCTEVDAVRRYVMEGGSLLCAGLAWPWVTESYGNKPVSTFPLNQIGKEVGFEITRENIGKPVALTGGLFDKLREEQLKTAGWWPSKVVSTAPNSEVVSRDPEGRPIVVALGLGKGRVIVFGHPGMLEEDEEIVRRSIGYLLPDAKVTPK
jgi:hypothetical protein